MTIRPDRPNDLAVPFAGSQTCRAIVSMAQRTLFDELKALAGVGADALPDRTAAALDDDTRALWAAVREVMRAFLPGRPRAVVAWMRPPPIAAPLRRFRDALRRAESDTRAEASAHP
ncbi:MAG: hypothetical protein KC543_11745, partial [Myxococcales bacterium]|nr:hypothetical protein [Myxococcales bacterium]